MTSKHRLSSSSRPEPRAARRFQAWPPERIRRLQVACGAQHIVRQMKVQVFCPFHDWIVCFFGVEFKKFFIHPSILKTTVVYCLQPCPSECFAKIIIDFKILQGSVDPFQILSLFTFKVCNTGGNYFLDIQSSSGSCEITPSPFYSYCFFYY